MLGSKKKEVLSEMVIDTLCSNAFGYKGRCIEDTVKRGNGINIYF